MGRCAFCWCWGKRWIVIFWALFICAAFFLACEGWHKRDLAWRTLSLPMRQTSLSQETNVLQSRCFLYFICAYLREASEGFVGHICCHSSVHWKPHSHVKALRRRRTTICFSSLQVPERSGSLDLGKPFLLAARSWFV